MRELHDRLENNLDLKCSSHSCTNIKCCVIEKIVMGKVMGMVLLVVALEDGGLKVWLIV
jgi:hypothetical protein